ncbi:MAG: hypothetical protein HDT42_02740 [Ruminococcaceae bacterium]|nr:hypothetical protein [Oscillospiraceae bacterium]
MATLKDIAIGSTVRVPYDEGKTWAFRVVSRNSTHTSLLASSGLGSCSWNNIDSECQRTKDRIKVDCLSVRVLSVDEYKSFADYVPVYISFWTSTSATSSTAYYHTSSGTYITTSKSNTKVLLPQIMVDNSIPIKDGDMLSQAITTIPIPTISPTGYTYDGNSYDPTINYNGNESYITTSKSYDGKQSAVGAYTIAFTLKDSTKYNWSNHPKNEPQGEYSITWSITAPAITSVQKPTVEGTSFTYNGSPQAPKMTYDQANVEVILPSDYTNVGRYMGIFRLKDKSKNQWVGGGTDDVSFIWEIKGIPITTGEISQKGVLTYNGEEQTPRWNNYDSSKMTIAGCTSATNAGDYIATFAPKPGYTWSNGTTYAIEITWTINKKPIPPPTPSWTSREYNGKTQIPVFDFHGEGDAYTSAKIYNPNGEFLCDIDIPKGHS